MADSGVIEELKRVRAVPVLLSATAQEAIRVGTALAAGGLAVLELRFSTPERRPGDCAPRHRSGCPRWRGEGADRRPGPDSGESRAQLLVSPLWPPRLPNLATELGVVAIPGASTPTEVWQAHLSGVPAVTVFPIARLGGASDIRDLLAPLPNVRLMATGGADLHMAGELIDAGCVAVGLGSIHKDGTLSSTIQERARRVYAALTER
jgi:2-dehydro-3-deoxyphosphogluconate aldolase/(4S)-4-hydroxy-2-oxoglutarate aldolase